MATIRSGCPSCQPEVQAGRGGRSLAFPSGLPRSTHLSMRRDLPLGQPASAGKVAVSRLRLPWRHPAAVDRAGNFTRARPHVIECHEAEWSELIGTVARRAVLPEKRCNVLVERDVAGRCVDCAAEPACTASARETGSAAPAASKPDRLRGIRPSVPEDVQSLHGSAPDRSSFDACG